MCTVYLEQVHSLILLPNILSSSLSQNVWWASLCYYLYIYIYIHTHTHKCVCVCVCVVYFSPLHPLVSFSTTAILRQALQPPTRILIYRRTILSGQVIIQQRIHLHSLSFTPLASITVFMLMTLKSASWSEKFSTGWTPQIFPISIAISNLPPLSPLSPNGPSISRNPSHGDWHHPWLHTWTRSSDHFWNISVLCMYLALDRKVEYWVNIFFQTNL
jgi:hypothetical protein